MKHRIITISREFGSRGRTIGKKVAEALGISCYDNELIQKIAAESGFNENYGSTAQFGKSIRPKILPHTKVIKGREYCMYFPLL